MTSPWLASILDSRWFLPVVLGVVVGLWVLLAVVLWLLFGRRKHR